VFFNKHILFLCSIDNIWCETLTGVSYSTQVMRIQVYWKLILRFFVTNGVSQTINFTLHSWAFFRC